MGRHDLSDEHWQRVRRLLPEPKPPGSPGRRSKDRRQILNGILWIKKTGSPWRDLPRERFGPWQTTYGYFNRWSKSGLFDDLLEAMQRETNGEDRIDWNLWCIDGSVTRAHRAASGAKKGVRREG